MRADEINWKSRQTDLPIVLLQPLAFLAPIAAPSRHDHVAAVFGATRNSGSKAVETISLA
jgi:hypothetical protein